MRLHKTLKFINHHKQSNRLLQNSIAWNFNSLETNLEYNKDVESLKFDEDEDQLQSSNQSQVRYNVHHKGYYQREQKTNYRSKYQNRNDSVKQAEEFIQRAEVYNKFNKLAIEEKYNSQEFLDLKQDIIKQIQRATQLKHLIKYLKRLQSFKFSDRELLNVIAQQADQVKQSFEVCNTLCLRYEAIDKQYRPSIVYFLETTLRNITKQEEISFNMLDFGFNNLSKVFVDDYTLYDTLMTCFENNVDNFQHYQFVSLIQKVIRLVSKLKMNEKYVFTCQVIKARMRQFMIKPECVQRMLNITQIANDPSKIDQLGGTPRLQQLTLTKIAFILSREINILVSQNKINLHKNKNLSPNQTQNDTYSNLKQQNNLNQQVDDDEFADEYQEEYSVIYQQAWKQLQQYAKDYNKQLDNTNFKILLISLVSSRTGDSALYSQMLDEFHHRITTQPYEQIENDFFCVCLRYFYTARFTPINVERYEHTFAEFTRRRFKSLSIPHKMAIFISYSTISDNKMIQFLLESEQLSQNDINKLNYKGKIHLFWAFCNVNQFKEDLFEQFLINECDASNSFYGESPKQLVQVTQLLQIIKVTRKEFWKKHKQILDQKLSEFSELTHFYLTQRFENQIPYQKKTLGIFNFSDVLTSLGIEYYCDPVVDKIFDVSYLLKGISEAKIQEFIQKNVAAASQFRDLQYQDSQFIPLFDETKHKINKKKDILLEIDNQPSYVSQNKKTQAANCKVDILRKMGYKVLQLNLLQLQRIAQLKDRKQIIFEFIKLLKEQVDQPSQYTLSRQTKKQKDLAIEDVQDKSGDEKTENN